MPMQHPAAKAAVLELVCSAEDPERADIFENEEVEGSALVVS